MTMQKTEWLRLGAKEAIKIEYGLRWLRGNRSAYFSVTADIREYRNGHVGREIAGGCCHDEVLKACPAMADLVALHLCDANGAPLHAIENGFYWLGSHPEYQRLDYTKASAHLRVAQADLESIIPNMFGHSFSLYAGFLSEGERSKAKARFSEYVDSLRPRWKQEANAAILRHGLIVPATPEK